MRPDTTPVATPDAQPDVSVPQPALVLEWDQEARERAWRECKRLAGRDPEAAAVLLAQLEAQAARDRATPVTAPTAATPSPAPAQPQPRPRPRGQYDPAKLYARACKFYGWSWRACDEMEYASFFAAIREAHLMNEEERAAIERERPSASPLDATNGTSTMGNGGSGVSDLDLAAVNAQLTRYAARPVPYRR